MWSCTCPISASRGSLRHAQVTWDTSEAHHDSFLLALALVTMATGHATLPPPSLSEHHVGKTEL